MDRPTQASLRLEKTLAGMRDDVNLGLNPGSAVEINDLCRAREEPGAAKA